jgi:hypothetical protein
MLSVAEEKGLGEKAREFSRFHAFSGNLLDTP